MRGHTLTVTPGVGTVDTMGRYRWRTVVGVLAVACGAVSCGSRAAGAVLVREDLFSLALGRAEDGIDLFARDGAIGSAQTSAAMRDGFVYIANGPAGKVMEFSSFGDLLSIVYDPERVPAPIAIADVTVGGRARAYDFLELGPLAVGTAREVYIVDRVPQHAGAFDEQRGAWLNRVVVQVDFATGVAAYIGQEGLGGTPFPAVERVAVSTNREVAVITRTEATASSFVYDGDGRHRYTLHIPLSRLPVPAADSDLLTQLDVVMPSVDGARLYTQVSYFRAAIDPVTETRSSIDFDHSRVYWIDVDSGRFVDFLEVPSSRSRQYRLIGVTRGEYLFLLAGTADGEELIILNDKGRTLRRRSLEIASSRVVTRSLSVSPDGVLTGLLGYHDHAALVWWRSDRLLPGIATGGS